MKDTEFASKVLAIVERSLCVLGIQGSVFSRSRLLFPLGKFSFGCLGRHDGYPFTPYYRYELEGFLEDSLGLGERIFYQFRVWFREHLWNRFQIISIPIISSFIIHHHLLLSYIGATDTLVLLLNNNDLGKLLDVIIHCFINIII